MFDEPSIEMLAALLVSRSRAVTCTMPLASISKVTSTCGFFIPRRRPPSMNLPSDVFSLALGLSPCSTFISTVVCMGETVV